MFSESLVNLLHGRLKFLQQFLAIL